MRLAEGANYSQEIDSSFDQLGDDFISVGNSLDYYERLNEIEPSLRDKVLEALQDAVFLPGRIEQFRDSQAWSTSLFRGSSSTGQPRAAQDAFLRDAAAILTRNFTELADLSTEFSFTPTGWTSSFLISYNAPSVGDPKMDFPLETRERLAMPRRLAILIGRNGAGKSTLLARLARVAHASPQDRLSAEIRELGTLEPPGLGFMRIIAVSYSAFDSFALPGRTLGELKQIANDVERDEGRYIFSGLRDIVAEVREDIERFRVDNPDAQDNMNLPADDRRPTTKLKSLEALAVEFSGLLERINQEKDRRECLDEALEPILADPSFRELEESTIGALVGDDAKSAFLSWSTGHKIILHVIASIVAHATPRSLLLFDEPETHLHPPLVAALMAGVRTALEKQNAFGVIATHSPVVLQESLSRHVRIIERMGEAASIRTPSNETFGENIGALVYDTFGLTSGATDFHNVLDQLIEASDSVEEIDAYFTPGLSAQARAYVMSRLAEKPSADG